MNFDGLADLIFIDGEHTYDAALADVRKFVPNNLRPGGYFILHDYYGWYDAEKKSRSPVRVVVEELIAEGELEHLLIDTGYQSFVIFRKRDPRAEGTLGKVQLDPTAEPWALGDRYMPARGRLQNWSSVHHRHSA